MLVKLAARILAAFIVISSPAMVASCAHPSPDNPATMPKPPSKTAQTKPKPPNAPADQPAARKDRNGQPDAQWMQQHQANNARANKGMIDLYFTGDALTQRFADTGKTVWENEFTPWKPANFAIGGDKTQNLLWRLQNGELDGVAPKAFVLMIGANNHAVNTPEQTAQGVAAIVKTIREKNPRANILLLGILPRNGPADAARKANEAVNALLAKWDDGKQVKYLDITTSFLTANGTLREDLIARDHTYLTEKGYQVWADAIKPVLKEWLGPQTRLH